MNGSRLVWVLILAMCAAACGASKLSASRVREAEDSDLTDCTALQLVRGKARDGDGDPVTSAKNAAKEAAAALGATHIRWLVPCCDEVEGTAFRCDLPED